MGVKAMKFSENEFLVEAIVCKPDTKILTISSRGFGKRSTIDEYRTQKRNGKGIYAGKFTEETGNLVAIKQLDDNQDAIIITNNGIMIRTPINDISVISRNTKGVKIMKLKKNDYIVSVAIVEHEEEENKEEILTENPESTDDDVIENLNDNIQESENTETEEAE